LSTDFVLANNLRGVNYAYRNVQLEPQERIPGFWSHQSERHFDDGVGPGINGNHVANFSAIHQRDFDINGYRFGLLSSVGTAGLNNVAAMLPARDLAENAAFPAADVAWIKKWQGTFPAEYADLLHRTISIATLDRGVGNGGGKPRLGYLDGTGSFADDDSEGIVFLFNPGPRPVSGWLTLDESLGISNLSSTSTWLAHELYPREETAAGEQTPIGLWDHGSSVEIYVPPTSAMVLRFRKQPVTPLATTVAPPPPGDHTGTRSATSSELLPLVLNLTHTSAVATFLPTGNAGKFRVQVNITGATGRVGEDARFEVIAAAPNLKQYRIDSVYVNGILAYTPPGYGYDDACTAIPPPNASCVVATVTFAGGSVQQRASKEATLTSPNPSTNVVSAGWFNSTLDVDQALFDQLNASQQRYPVPWVKDDMTAPWLGNRLLLYPYITQPNANLTRPRIWLAGVEQSLIEAYNSRGNVESKCFLGFYFDASDLMAGQYDLAVWLPQLNGTSDLVGMFWSGLHDEFTTEVAGPRAPAGSLETCASAASTYPPPPKDAKNVLYLVLDDLRPQLGAYGQKQTHTPNLNAFAMTATVFDNAYCNIAVCSPSRNSFLSGRWPRSSHIYNFINHVRQADCPSVVGATVWVGNGLRNVSIAKTEGAAGECCTQCTKDPACHAWTYIGASVVDGATAGNTAGSPALKAGQVKDHCTLFGEGTTTRAPSEAGVISGTSGKLPSTLVSLPQHFKQSGYLALQTGKIWHTEEGNPQGTGMPPQQDYPHSWSDGCSMANVNDAAQMWGCDVVTGTQGCPVDTNSEGDPSDPSTTAPLCDKTIGDDAIVKLELAAKHQLTTGRPFMLSVGFRKPHMPWRFPKSMLSNYPPAADITTALHPTMDVSVPSIAHHTPDLQSMGGGDPYHALNKSYAQLDRLFYYAAVTWTDMQVGRVLDKLDALSLTPSTLVVFHSDHGWARCSSFDRSFHLKMVLDSTIAGLKPTCV
jgi:arylsulfatase A-like enzyme